jgi:hypothetical protein
MREEPFNKDGVAGKSVDYAIITVEVDPSLKALTQIEGTIVIANEQYSFTLLQNPYNPLSFTNDIVKSLKKAVSPTDEVEITLVLASNNHPTMKLENVFGEDAVSWNTALRIAIEKCGNKFKNKKFETYITIVKETAQGGGAYWYIQFVTQDGKTHFCIVAQDGTIIG